ncbi:MAG TPA: patatin-like phospholipase family protein [Candidatus Paceibacterota bacterium]
MSDRGKTAIVMAGGAMRSAHGAGFLFALRNELKLKEPDMMIGSSGDAGNVLYYCADQFEEMKRVWIDLLTTTKFISLKRFWRIMDVDYLVDECFSKLEPLDLARVRASPIQWFIPLTNYDTGITRYVSAKDQLNTLEVLRAAKAIPLVYGKRVSITNSRYIDGELGPTLEDHARFAVARGADRLLVLRHNSIWSLVSKTYGRLFASTVSEGLRRSIIHDMTKDSIHITVPEAKMILLVPKNLPVRNPTDNNKAHVEATFNRGFQDAVALRHEITALFQQNVTPEILSMDTPIHV